MRKVLAKERKGKEIIILKLFTSKKKLDTIANHQNKHTIEDQGCSWTTPLKNCVGAVFLNFIWVLIRHPIFWEITVSILRIPKERN